MRIKKDIQKVKSCICESLIILLKVCGASDKQELPPNFIKLAKDVYTPDLIAASDCMLGKNHN